MSDFGWSSEDVEAIDRYLHTSATRTSAAQKIQDDYKMWFRQSSWWDMNMSDDWYDELRSWRNKFNLANARTEAERQNVIEVITTGQTTEELDDGDARPKTDITGNVGSQVPSTPGEKLKKAAIIAGVGAGVITVLTLVVKGYTAPLRAALSARSL